jgi:AcrR family transcriptional regulator
MKMEKKKDLRVIKTQKLLFTTMMELMKTKSFDEIKVSDICNKALINRSTFYAHYNDKYELLVDFFECLKEELINALNKNEHIINTKEYYMEMLKLLLDYMDAQRDVYYAMLMNNRDSIINDIIIDAINKDIGKRLEESGYISGNLPGEIVSTFYLSAVSGVIVEWLKNSHKYTKNDILDYLTKLIPDNIGEL